MNSQKCMKKLKRIHPTVEICRECSGVGANHVFDNEDLFQRGDTHAEICSLCNGSGRVIVSKTIEVTIEAFKAIT